MLYGLLTRGVFFFRGTQMCVCGHHIPTNLWGHPDWMSKAVHESGLAIDVHRFVPQVPVQLLIDKVAHIMRSVRVLSAPLTDIIVRTGVMIGAHAVQTVLMQAPNWLHPCSLALLFLALAL